MKEIKILLLYPPEQSWPKTMVKPNGSLAYPYLGGALRDIGVDDKELKASSDYDPKLEEAVGNVFEDDLSMTRVFQ